MQVLEKAALEDPFLADAIEGFEESRKHAVSFETGIADLKTKLSERISQRNSRRGLLFQLTKWPVAASFVLVIGLAIFMVTYVNKKPGISQTNARPDSAAVTLIKPSQENPAKSDSIKSDEESIASVRSGKEEKKDTKTDEQAIASVRSGKGEKKDIKTDEQAIASVRTGKGEKKDARTEIFTR
jgi:cytoskeletal protein RodZ